MENGYIRRQYVRARFVWQSAFRLISGQTANPGRHSLQQEWDRGMTLCIYMTLQRNKDTKRGSVQNVIARSSACVFVCSCSLWHQEALIHSPWPYLYGTCMFPPKRCLKTSASSKNVSVHRLERNEQNDPLTFPGIWNKEQPMLNLERAFIGINFHLKYAEPFRHERVPVGLVLFEPSSSQHKRPQEMRSDLGKLEQDQAKQDFLVFSIFASLF